MKVGQDLVSPASTVERLLQGDGAMNARNLQWTGSAPPADALSHEGSFTLEGKSHWL